MIYYRMALRGSQSTKWRWKSSPFTSLNAVLMWLRLYRCVPREHIRIILSSSPEHMETMLSRINQGLFSTAITVDQLWDRYSVNWIDVRRLEVELEAVSDHDQAYTWSMHLLGSHVLAWAKLRALREQGALES
jgi:hypothetical protein